MMCLRIVQLIAVILAALGLSLGVAHALELPPKLHYDANLYLRVTSTLYRLFGSIGAIFQMGALLSVSVLCWLVRRRRSFRLTLAALVALIVSLVLWAALVQPVNAQWGNVLKNNPSAAPAAYIELRPRWEFGHVAACIAWLAGFTCLVISLLVEIPNPQPSSRSVTPPGHIT